MNFIDLRLKIRHFFRRNQRILFVIIIVWAIVLFINMILTNRPKEYVADTTYEAHTSVINNSNSTPKSMQEPIEKMIEEYVKYCNAGNYQAAFNMLSSECREYGFENKVENFMRHVYTKMPLPREYAIQNYSSTTYGNKNMYIYEVRYFDDFLATGLTNSQYSYTSENITFFREDNEIKMNVGNYIYHNDIKNISENEYLKIDVVDKIVNYSIETYKVKFTNRSNYTIVISDGQEIEEVLLALSNETRNPGEIQDIVLEPNGSIQADFVFPKFVDDGDSSQSLVFPAIRVMEKYSGTGDEIPEETIQYEIDNAISKFSMEVDVLE